MWQHHAWRTDASLLSRAMRPLAALFGRLADEHRRRATVAQLPVPVVVVGNFVAGGAGKTPVVIALVEALAAAGLRPGVISRGHGRTAAGVMEVHSDCDPRDVGDEPLLIHRRTGVPVFVGRARWAAGRALCTQHPAVDVLISDDGMQHPSLGRDLTLAVIDERGVGNGMLLPAGPLREPLPTVLPADTRVLYTGGRRTTPLPGTVVERRPGPVSPLADWWAGDERRSAPLGSFAGREVLAVAGLAQPEKFFAMLEAEGLTIVRVGQPDHARYETLPWRKDESRPILVTEKDAVKLAATRSGTTHVHVVRLDSRLPAPLVADILQTLKQARPR